MTTLVVDGQNLAYRTKYSFNLDHRGVDVSILYGFLRVLISDAQVLGATSIIVCWDGGIPEQRRLLLPEYKAHRVKDWTEDEIASFYGQLDELQAILPEMGVISLRMNDAEADDLMYQLSRMVVGPCMLYTTDGDMAQCVTPDDRVQVYYPLNEKALSWSNYPDHMTVEPWQWVDYRAMTGDSSDGIKGVHGVGAKSATDILKQYPTLDAAIRAAKAEDPDWQPSKMARTYLSRADQDYVDRIRRVMDLSEYFVDAKSLIRDAVAAWHPYDYNKIRHFMLSHGFKSMMDIGSVPVRAVLENVVQPQLTEAIQEQTLIVMTQG